MSSNLTNESDNNLLANVLIDFSKFSLKIFDSINSSSSNGIYSVYLFILPNFSKICIENKKMINFYQN